MKLQVYHDPLLQLLTELVPSAEIRAVKMRCRQKISQAEYEVASWEKRLRRQDDHVKDLITVMKGQKAELDELKKKPKQFNPLDPEWQKAIDEIRSKSAYATHHECQRETRELVAELQELKGKYLSAVAAHGHQRRELAAQNARLVDQLRKLLDERGKGQPAPAGQDQNPMEYWISKWSKIQGPPGETSEAALN